MFCFNSKKVGYVKKTHGIKGELIVELDFKIPKKINFDQWVYIEYEGTIIPFSIEYYQILDEQTFLVKLSQINSINEAKCFSLCNFHVNEKLSWIINYEYLFVGYKLFDKNNHLLGEIIDYFPIENNPVVQVKYNSQKYLIPINKELIIEQNDSKKTIRINLVKDELI